MPIVQPPRTLSSEMRSCAIHCLRAAHDPQAVQYVSNSFNAPTFDWCSFKEMVYGERIAPLIHYRVGLLNLLPAELEDGFRQAYLQTVWANNLLMTELEKLLQLFAHANVPVIVLKGPALILTVYEKGALRPMVDLDLLVHDVDRERASRVLVDQGYSTTPAMFPSPYESEYVFTGSQHSPITVELHASLFQIPHLFTAAQMEWFWTNSATLPLGQAHARVLEPEPQVLYLCAHLWLHHQGGDLCGWNDIHEVICKFTGEIGWTNLFSTAQSLDLLIPLQKTLPELAQDWHTPIPENAAALLRGLQPIRREQRKFQRLWWQQYNFAELLLVDLASLPGWRNRLRYLWYRLFPQPNYMIERYHLVSRLFLPYAYLYRWLTTFIKR